MNKRILDIHEGKAPAAAAPKDDALREGQLTPSDVLSRARANVEHMAKGGELHVVGEISGLKTTTQGHWTFDLKDKRAALPAIVFYNDTRRVLLQLGFSLEHGMHIVAKGTPTVSFARVQLVIKSVELFSKDGALEAAARALKSKLEGEGLFDPARKKPLPRLPRSVGIVTSSTGAAVRDCVNILFARAPRLRVIVAPTKVQGHEAAADIADAVKRLDKSGLCDVILVVRGGGSLEDLQAFNSEPVARAIAFSKTPVIAGVGHATDNTIADLVADRRAETPSNAAELAVPVVAELEVKLDSYAKRLASSVRPLLDRRRRIIGDHEKRMERALVRRRDLERTRLARLDQRVRARAPDRVLAEKRAALVEMEKRLGRALQQRRDTVTQQRRQLDALHARLEPALARTRAKLGSAFGVLVARLESISPLTVLGRGYAIARRKRDGHVVRTPGDAPAGTKLAIRVEGGELDATVDAVDAVDE